ncbi:hypothetical protein D3C72_1029740 [compost metagenome]
MCITTASLLLSRFTPGSVERMSAVIEMRSGKAACALAAPDRLASASATAAFRQWIFIETSLGLRGRAWVQAAASSSGSAVRL